MASSTPAKVLRVKDWNGCFENNRTRELKEMTWFPVPNRFDGDGYTEIIEGHKNGPAHYAAWVVICGVASRCEPRGTLLRDGSKAHDSVSLSRKTRLPQALFDEAIPRLISIGWLVCDCDVNPCQQSNPQEGAGISHPTDYGMEWKGMEGKGNKRQSPAANVVGCTEEKSRHQTEPKGAEDVPIPEKLDTPEFDRAWRDWIADRKDRKKKLTVRAAVQQLGRLAEIGSERAVAAIEHSIASGYQGIFEPSAKAGSDGGGVAGSSSAKAQANLSRLLAEMAGEK